MNVNASALQNVTCRICFFAQWERAQFKLTALSPGYCPLNSNPILLFVMMNEIVFYNFKVSMLTTLMREPNCKCVDCLPKDREYFVLSWFTTKPIFFTSVSSLEKVKLTALLLRSMISISSAKASSCTVLFNIVLSLLFLLLCYTFSVGMTFFHKSDTSSVGKHFV